MRSPRFDATVLRAIDRAAASIALVLSVDDRGTAELLYAATGVVRRGFLTPSRPSVHRDTDGRILNTFLRHLENQPPPGTRFLASQLAALVIDLDHLRRPHQRPKRP